ncbi:MAG: type IVB secretion system protein DotA [Legionellales bacterium]|nr:type IVB secretion system protein DotA [Legionellales bacterium]
MKYWLFICLSLLVPKLALAANPLDFTPPPDDLSINFLGSIFGVVDGVLSGSGSQILGQMFAIFNAAVLAIGGIILLYVTIVSTLNTANEGEFLGKKWSSIWIPVRAVVGVALLIPKQSGYCLMQIFVMWIVVQGVGAADKVWGAALDYMASGGTIVNEDPFPEIFKQDSASVSASSNMLLAQTCLNTLHRFLEETRRENVENGLCPPPGDPNSPWWCNNIPNFSNSVASELMRSSSQGGSSNVTVSMPNLDKNVYSEIHGVCGDITVLTFGQPDERGRTDNQGLGNQVGQMRSVGATQVFLNLGAVAQKIVRNQFERERPLLLGEAGQATYREGKSVGSSKLWRNDRQSNSDSNPEKSVRTWKASSGAALLTGKEIIDASNVYVKIVEPALRAVALSKKSESLSLDFIAQAKSEGWILAGAYFYDLVKLNNEYNSVQFNADDDGVVVKFSINQVSEENDNLSKLTQRQGRNKPVALTETQLKQLKAILAGGQWEAVNKDSNMKETKSIEGSNSVSGHLEQVKLMVASGNPYENKAPNFDTDVQNDFKTTGPKLELPDIKIKAGWFNIAGSILTFLYNDLIKPVMNIFFNIAISSMSFLVDIMLGIPLKLIVDTFEATLKASLEVNSNPISILSGFGAILMNIAINSWVTSVLMAGKIGVIATIATGGILLMFIGLAPLVFSMLTAVFLSGAMLAFYVPLIPYIIFLFGTLAWFIGVIESMVAAPIVALGIMHPEGHEAFGKADNAVMLILNVFLRPSMMVIGFVAGIILSYVGLWLINFAFDRVVIGVVDLTFESALKIGRFESGIFVPMIAKVLLLVMYVTLVLTTIQKSFSLIHYVPDKVLRWLSGGLQEQLGSNITESSAQEAQSMARQTAGTAAQMAGGQGRQNLQQERENMGKEDQIGVQGGGGNQGGGNQGGGDEGGGKQGDGNEGGTSARVEPQQLHTGDEKEGS